jgi:hypothetical protein
MFDHAEDVASQHVVKHQDVRQRVDELVLVAKEMAVDRKMGTDLNNLVKRYGLTFGLGAHPIRWMHNNVGLITSDTAIRILGDAVPYLKPWKGAALVVGYQGAPRRVRGLAFAANANIHFGEIQLDTTTEYVDNGLAFLDSLDTENDAVYATNDLFVAANMQGATSMLGRPLPVVAFRTGTTESWYYVKSSRVYFWVRELTPGVVNSALRSNDPHITVDHDFLTAASPRDLHERVRRASNVKLVTRIHRYRKHWAQTVREFLLQNPRRVRHFVSELDLTPAHCDEILRACRRNELAVMTDYLNMAPSTRRVEVHGKTVEERRDGYYHVPNSGKDSQITNFVFGQSTIVRVTDTDKVKHKGSLKSAGRTFEFTVDHDSVTRDPCKELQKPILDVGGPMLSLDSKWKSRLFDIAFAMHEPKYDVIERVPGWNARRQGYSFPQFNVVGGRAEALTNINLQTACAVLKPGYQGVTHRDRQELHRQLSGLSDDVTVAWTLFIVFVYNLMAIQYDWPPVATGVVTPSRQDTHDGAKQFARAVGLTTVSPAVHYNNWLLRFRDRLAAANGVPVVVQVPAAHKDHTLDWIAEAEAMPIITSVTQRAADVGAILRPDWVFLTTGSRLTGNRIKGVNRLVGEFLAWLQRQARVSPSPEFALTQVRNLVMTWARDTFAAPKDGPGLDAVFKRVRVPTSKRKDIVAPAGERLFRALTMLYARGELSVKRTKSILRVDGTELVIDLVRLAGALTRARYPMPTANVMTDMLCNAGVIKRVLSKGSVVVATETWDRLKLSEAPSAQLLAEV